MSLRSQIGAARSGIMASFYRRVVPFTGREAIVSFTFDDFPRSALTAGASILEAFNARGTYYTAAALMNTSGELGDHFTADDLHELLEKGHELGNHTFSHLSSRSVSCSAFCFDVEEGRHVLEERTGVNPDNFSYPFGDITLRAKKAVGRHVGSARSIIPGINIQEIDLNLLRANKLYGDIDQAGRLNGLIDENVRRRGWLIFYTHDVRPQPSAYGCTPALFESVVSAAARSENQILTVGQALSSLGVGPAVEAAQARTVPY
jgi:peptidoglycan/xylan/chitin deacetylase (PgdA/CDA1 family)